MLVCAFTARSLRPLCRPPCSFVSPTTVLWLRLPSRCLAFCLSARHLRPLAPSRNASIPPHLAAHDPLGRTLALDPLFVHWSSCCPSVASCAAVPTLGHCARHCALSPFCAPLRLCEICLFPWAAAPTSPHVLFRRSCCGSSFLNVQVRKLSSFSHSHLIPPPQGKAGTENEKAAPSSFWKLLSVTFTFEQELRIFPSTLSLTTILFKIFEACACRVSQTIQHTSEGYIPLSHYFYEISSFSLLLVQ